MLNLEDRVKYDMNKPVQPKILFFDIETTPIKAYTWGPKWETNLIEFLEYSQILSYSAKWYKGKQETKGQIDYKGYRPKKLDDSKIVKDIHNLFDEADIIVTQNGVSFDTKTMNARFIKSGLAPPSPYKNVDTKLEAKKYLRLPSYSLDDMGDYFGLGRKMHHTGFDLWKECMNGNKKAWTTMKKYNAQDVLLLEKLYNKIKPYMKSHPNFGEFLEKSCCGGCGSNHLNARGYARTSTAVYQRFQCMDCGSWGRTQAKERSFKINKRL